MAVAVCSSLFVLVQCHCIELLTHANPQPSACLPSLSPLFLSNSTTLSPPLPVFFPFCPYHYCYLLYILYFPIPSLALLCHSFRWPFFPSLCLRTPTPHFLLHFCAQPSFVPVFSFLHSAKGKPLPLSHGKCRNGRLRSSRLREIHVSQQLAQAALMHFVYAAASGVRVSAAAV